MENEDAKRPHRERESLVAERTRIVNRMKGCLARLGIRTFKPTLQRARDLLPTLRTPEGTPQPPNALAEMRRDLARLRLVEDQVREIEADRLERLNQAPDEKSHVMVRLLAQIIGVGIETADMLVREVLSRNLRDRPRWHVTPVSRGHRTRAARSDGRRGLPGLATPECGGA